MNGMRTPLNKVLMALNEMLIALIRRVFCTSTLPPSRAVAFRLFGLVRTDRTRGTTLAIRRTGRCHTLPLSYEILVVPAYGCTVLTIRLRPTKPIRIYYAAVLTLFFPHRCSTQNTLVTKQTKRQSSTQKSCMALRPCCR